MCLTTISMWAYNNRGSHVINNTIRGVLVEIFGGPACFRSTCKPPQLLRLNSRRQDHRHQHQDPFPVSIFITTTMNNHNNILKHTHTQNKKQICWLLVIRCSLIFLIRCYPQNPPKFHTYPCKAPQNTTQAAPKNTKCIFLSWSLGLFITTTMISRKNRSPPPVDRTLWTD